MPDEAQPSLQRLVPDEAQSPPPLPGTEEARPSPATPPAAPPDEARPTPLQAALDRVGDRWSLLVVESLLEGPGRFNDLQATLPGIAPNILSDRLKRLERERVLLARPYSQRPVRLSYELTAEGRELAGALRLLADWGARADSSDTLRHQACGTPLEARWYCPTCARAIAEDETTELRQL